MAITPALTTLEIIGIRLKSFTSTNLMDPDTMNIISVLLYSAGLIVGMILLAVLVIALVACIISAVYRRKEHPKMKKPPRHIRQQ